VLWPTALAVPVMRGALTRALEEIAEPARGDGQLAALAEALATACALLRSLRALLAVDRGGLQDVAL
jgi:hypothetical protein